MDDLIQRKVESGLYMDNPDFPGCEAWLVPAFLLCIDRSVESIGVGTTTESKTEVRGNPLC